MHLLIKYIPSFIFLGRGEGDGYHRGKEVFISVILTPNGELFRRRERIHPVKSSRANEEKREKGISLLFVLLQSFLKREKRW